MLNLKDETSTQGPLWFWLTSGFVLQFLRSSNDGIWHTEISGQQVTKYSPVHHLFRPRNRAFQVKILSDDADGNLNKGKRNSNLWGVGFLILPH